MIPFFRPLAAILLSAALVVLLPAAAALGTPLLKSKVTIDGEEIRLSDLLAGAGPAADITIAKAPEPGGKMVIATSRVSAAARANGVAFRNPLKLRRVLVTRNGDPIARARIEKRLRAELRPHAPSNRFQIEFAGDVRRLIVPKGQGRSAAIALHALDYDRASYQFTALLSAPAANPDARRVQVRGWLRPVISVPMPRRVIARGEVIERADIEWREVRTDQIERQAVTQIGKIVGAEARYILRPGRPLRDRDLKRHAAVAKGALVTLVVQSPGLALTTRGRALKDGAIGEVIPIQNTQSKRVVQATVTGPGTAEIIIRRQLVAVGN